ncbi:unnamed protein product, partial [Ixodes hexagonus]
TDSFVKNRAKRARPDKAGRFAALERLKQVKGGTRSKFELKEEVSVYEEVDEKEYSRLVQKRQEEDWIIDDGGAGYVEDGREIFDDDIGETDDTPKKEASSTKNKYRPPSSKKVAAPKAGTIAAMFSAQPKKKAEKEVNLNDDELLDNILQSVDKQSSGSNMSAPFVLTPKAPRKSTSSSTPKSPANPFAKNGRHPSSREDVKPRAVSHDATEPQKFTSLRRVQVKEEERIEQFDSEDLTCDLDIEEDSPMSPAAQAPHENDQTVDEDLACFADARDDDFHMEVENGQAAAAGTDPKHKKEVIREDPLDDDFPDWNGVFSEESIPLQTNVKLDSLPLIENDSGEKVVRFFWLDAYEDYFKSPGVVHLFGKVKLLESSTHASCAVTVSNIPRRVYLLPRPFHYDSATKTETDEPVTMKDVYDEFRRIAEKQRIEEFKTKAVTKRYAFDREGVPAEAEYLEIVYPAQFPELPKDLTGRTFSAVFGTNTSSLEALLIGQKLMGPCWLELRNPLLTSVCFLFLRTQLVLSKPSDIVVAKSEPAPPLVVVALSTRTIPNDATNQNEVVAVSVLAHHAFPIDKQAPTPLYQTHFCGFRVYDTGSRVRYNCSCVRSVGFRVLGTGSHVYDSDSCVCYNSSPLCSIGSRVLVRVFISMIAVPVSAIIVFVFAVSVPMSLVQVPMSMILVPLSGIMVCVSTVLVPMSLLQVSCPQYWFPHLQYWFRCQFLAGACVFIVDFSAECVAGSHAWVKYKNSRKQNAAVAQVNLQALTKPSGTLFPYGFTSSMCKHTNLEVVDSERSLLIVFAAKFQGLDPDIIVGHDIQSYDLNVLLHRMISHKIPNWSRLGRLKRGNAAALGKTDKQLTPGRLVCDLKISSKELVQCKSYDLTELVKTLLQKERLELSLDRIQNMYSTSAQLLKLIDLTMMDAEFCLRLMSELNVLPLALQITNIAGNVLSKTLLGGRSQRNEYLLLHAFSDRNYICPDKTFKKQAPKVHDDETELPASKSKSKKGPTYSGGLVLEPKKGFYDSFILLMDFNSLYPSIIQEYNICFTTVDIISILNALAQADDYIPELPSSSADPGVLPSEIRKLVESRRQVKNLMKGSDVSADLYQQYDIRQKALKLTANSMYGCLGFAHSRFFAKPLAALITSRGREILMQTKELVEKMGLNVIYGDTDSIMINTNSRDLKEVLKLGNKVKAEINKFYKQLEIDIDGIFKSMLLLKKKKYAALVVSVGPNGQVSTTKQLKGLDIVRRDWSELARKTGEYVIDELLSDNSREDIVDKIHSYLMQLAAKIQEDSVPLSDYCVTKQLTKNPEDYPDKKNLSHVQVALRLNSKRGKKLKQGDTVTYVICNVGSSQTATQRAYHPEELKGNEGLSIALHQWMVQVIYPVRLRLCLSIDKLRALFYASAAGLNPAQYRHYNHNEDDDAERRLNDGSASGLSVYKLCERVKLTCPSEDCTAVITVEDIFEKTGMELKFVLEECPQCKTALCGYINALCNQVTLFIRDCISKFYAGWLVCEDTVCGHRTRRLPLRFVKASPLCFACERSVMRPEYKTSDLYNQLRYLSKLFDFSRAVTSLPENDKSKLAPAPFFHAVLHEAQVGHLSGA